MSPIFRDDLISTEIPDKQLNMGFYEAISECMLHGPCGPMNSTSRCMHDSKKCSKKFPKSFDERTILDGNGYPVYRVVIRLPLFRRMAISFITSAIYSYLSILKY